MTQQEEIREVIDAYTDDRCLYPDKTCAWCSKEGYCASDNDAYTCLMWRLGEQGVVIKVEREPREPGYMEAPGWKKVGWHSACKAMVRDGFTAVEPLIEVATIPLEEE